MLYYGFHKQRPFYSKLLRFSNGRPHRNQGDRLLPVLPADRSFRLRSRESPLGYWLLQNRLP